MRLVFSIILLCHCWSIQAQPASNQQHSEPQFDGQLALQHIANQIAFGPRSPDQPFAKQQTLDYIRQTIEPLASGLTVQSFVAHGLEGNNLWATFKGENTTTKRLMLGAHWDTRPGGSAQKPHLGANDGGSGVAVLLELARLLKQNRPPVTVDLVFFDLEDMGNIDGRPFAIGAEAFVARNKFYRPSAGAIVDMVCDKNLRLPKERFSYNGAIAIQDRIWQIAKDQNASGFIDQIGPPVQDDHVPFLKAGIPVVDIIHHRFPHYWHTHRDTLDKCSSASLKQVGNVLKTLIYSP